MIKASYICAAGMLTLSLVACSRDTSTTTPSQDPVTQAGQSHSGQTSDSGQATGAQPSLQAGAQAVGQNSGPPDREGSPLNKIRPQGITPITAVVFNVSAHADDWELFMNPDIYNEVNNENTKSVFIYTTAGDGGAGGGPATQPYFVAREDGANRAVRFIANVTPQFTSNSVVTKVRIRGHVIRKVTYKNTVSYFLRLSDGSPNGQGYSSDGMAYPTTPSLQHLYEGTATKMTAVDNSATYVGWADLKNTVASIISTEASPIGVASVNLMDPDKDINPGDHSDHLHSTLLVEDSLKNKNCVAFTYFKTYSASWENINVQTNDLLNQAAILGVMESGKGDSGWPGAWEEFHKTFLGKHYARTVPATSTGACL